MKTLLKCEQPTCEQAATCVCRVPENVVYLCADHAEKHRKAHEADQIEFDIRPLPVAR